MIRLAQGDFKDTAIGPIPAEWELVLLGEVIEVHDKRRIPLSSKQRQSMQGSYPYCGANGVIDHIDDYIFDGEFVLLAEDGGHWGRHEQSAYLMDGKFWVNNHAHIIRGLAGRADNHYLVAILNLLDLTGYISGTTRGKLNQGVMKRIPIPLPPLPEQRAIARILNAIQRAIAAQDAVIAAARELKRSLMARLFRYGPGKHPAETKDTEIGEIPAHWDVVPLGKVANLASGGTPSKKRPEWWEGTIPWVSPKDIKKPYLKDAQDHITPEGLENGSRLVPPGTLLIVVRGMILARDLPVTLTEAPVAFNQDVKAILPKDSIDATYLLYLLTSHHREPLVREIGTSAHGTRRIGTSSLENFLVPLPDGSEQRKIAHMMATSDHKIAAEEDRKTALETLFASMLEQLMTGRVRVRIPQSQELRRML